MLSISASNLKNVFRSRLSYRPAYLQKQILVTQQSRAEVFTLVSSREKMTSTKAVVVKNFGGYDVLSIEQCPLPDFKGLVEVKMEYGGLNFADLYMRKGLMPNKKVPFILGMEGVGTVTAVYNDSTNLKVGQKVICYNVNGGVFQETVRLPPENLFLLPNDIDKKIAATIFVNYLTAYFAIFYCASLKPNDEILIESCAGGVGWAATQLAKTVQGVKVFGTVSSWKEKEVKENGVDVVIARENLDRELENYNFDVILTNQSGEMLQRFQKQLKQLGRLVMLGASNIMTDEKKLSTFDLLKLWWHTKHVKPLDLVMNNRTVSGLHLAILLEKEPVKVRAALDEVFNLLRNEKIQPRIHSVLQLDEIVEASKILAERKNIGKVVININAEN